MKLRTIIVSSAIILASASPTPIGAQTALTSEQASRVFGFENLNMTPSRISGTITNRSPHTIKDVELVIQYHWLWQNEGNPGQHSPGRTAFIKLDGQFEPGQSRPFIFTPRTPLPSRSDGRFMTEVDVASFAVVVQQFTATEASADRRRPA